MIKKTLIGTAILLAAGTFVFGRDLFSYAKTAGSSVRSAVKSEVPLDFQIQRAREMVEDLVPDVRRCMHVIAEQQVDIERLQESITGKERELGQQKDVILTLRDDLQNGNGQFVYASRTYTPDEVKRDLSRRFERFKAAEGTLKRDRQVLEAREKSLSANEEKLENMLAAKKDLEVEIEQLEARLKTIQAAQTVSTIEIDDSQLARAKTLIRELNKQLDVREKMLDAEGKFTGLIPVETESGIPVDDVTGEIDAYFGIGSESGTDRKEAATDDLAVDPAVATNR